MHLARGLIESGRDCIFLTSAMWPQGHALMQLALRQPLATSPLGAELRRRALPPPLNGGNTVGVARAREYLLQASLRMRPAASKRIVRARTAQFRRDSAKWIDKRGLGEESDLIIAQYTSALEPFRASRQAKKLLMYPIAHHAWMTEFLGAEGSHNPHWAPFLQGHDLTREERANLDEEIHRADLVLLPCSFARDTFVDSGVDPGKLRILSLGVDFDEVAATPHTTSPSGPLELLFAGQINQRKGIGYLLEALATTTTSDWHLTLIGGASAAIRERLESDYPSVAIKGTMPRWELKRHMAQADVFVLPSLAEGFGLVALEAMSMGTPAIVTPRTFGADIVTSGEDGWIVPAGDAVRLSETLESIARDRIRLPVISNAARKTAQRYTWKSYARAATRLIQDEFD